MWDGPRKPFPFIIRVMKLSASRAGTKSLARDGGWGETFQRAEKPGILLTIVVRSSTDPLIQHGTYYDTYVYWFAKGKKGESVDAWYQLKACCARFSNLRCKLNSVALRTFC